MKVELIAITPKAELVIEEAGRTCYLSFDRKGRNTAGPFIQRLLRAGHTSVLEHASATFRISGVSRAMTHQLVRHRLASFSQQSQRYVDENNFKYVIPPGVEKDQPAVKIFRKTMEDIGNAYRALLDAGVKREDARFVLPNACTSEIVMSANFREWRHIFELRLSPRAQWEIRSTCMECLKQLKQKAPAVFGDFVINEKGCTAVLKKET